MLSQPHNAQLVSYDAAGNIVILGLRGEQSCHAEEARQSHFETPTVKPQAPQCDTASRHEASKNLTLFSKNFSKLAQEIIAPLKKASRGIAGAPASLRALTPHLPTIPLPPRAKALLSSGRFLARFSVTFAILFMLLNAQSFFAILRARVLPDADLEARTALEAITHEGFPALPLLAVPSLPTAGRSMSRVLAEKLRVAPPDDRLIIPKIAKNIPLVAATDAALRRGDFKTFEKDIQDALRYGVVRYPGTAEPGDPGNVFITGHSAYVFWDQGRYKEVFARLSELEPGDTYVIVYAEKLYHYRVTRKFEVSPKDISVLEQPRDKRMSTLMTCTPVGTTLRRLIIQAEEIDPATGAVRVAASEQPPVPSAVEGSPAAIKIPKFGGELPGWGNEVSL